MDLLYAVDRPAGEARETDQSQEPDGSPSASRRAGSPPRRRSSKSATCKVHFPTDDGLVKSVDGLSFTLEKGKTLGIVGESGSGKSRDLARHHGPAHAAAHAPAISGEIWLDGEELVGADPDQVRKLRGRKMAMIFQDPLSAMHPYYTVGDQIVEAYRVHHDVDQEGRPQARRSRCSTGSASRSPTSASTTTRTSSPAACGSAR